MADTHNPKPNSNNQQAELNPPIADLSVDEDLYDADPAPPKPRPNPFHPFLPPSAPLTAIQRLGIRARDINFANHGNNKILQDGIDHIAGICERLQRLDDLFFPNALDRKGYALLIELREKVKELDVFVEKMNPEVVDVEDPGRSTLSWWDEPERAVGSDAVGNRNKIIVCDKDEVMGVEKSTMDRAGAVGEQAHAQSQAQAQAPAPTQAHQPGPPRSYAAVASAAVSPVRVVYARELGFAALGKVNAECIQPPIVINWKWEEQRGSGSRENGNDNSGDNV